MNRRYLRRLAIVEVHPKISDDDLRAVAEILACVDSDPEARRAHRIEKLATFPEEDQPRLKSLANEVIQARSRARQVPKIELDPESGEYREAEPPPES